MPTLQRLAAALEARVLISPDIITFEPLETRCTGAQRLRVLSIEAHAPQGIKI